MVAFVLFKDFVVSCTDVLNSARLWARHGYRVDVLAYDTGLHPWPELGDEGIRFRLLRTLYARLLPFSRRIRGTGVPDIPATSTESTGRAAAPRRSCRRTGQGIVRAVAAAVRLFQKVEFFITTVWRLTRGGYRCVFACDTVSLLAARTVNLLRGVPYVYHSRELALSWDARGAMARLAKQAERYGQRHALFTVIQDRARAALLGRDNSIPPESFTIVPNAPLGFWPGEGSASLQRRLGLPEETPIVLYAGGVTPETMVAEIIESIADWPAGPVLVVHGASQTTYLPALRTAASRFPGRVFLSTLFTPPEEVDQLFASAAIGVAFYRPIDDNFRYVGHAAGKIFNLMKVGVPVVTNDLPGMRQLVEENGCGLVVDKPAGLGDALRRILADPERWRPACREAYPRYEFERNYAGVITRVDAALAGRSSRGRR